VCNGELSGCGIDGHHSALQLVAFGSGLLRTATEECEEK